MFEVNDRVQFSEELQIDGFDRVAKGEMGWVEAVGADGGVWIQLDQVHPALASWQNCVYLPAHFEPRAFIARIASRAA